MQIDELQQILDQTPSLVYVYHVVEQRNVYVNRETGVVLGYSVSEIQEMGAALMSKLMHPDDLARLPNHHARLAASSAQEVVEFTYRMRHNDGAWRWLLSRDVVYTRLEDGSVEQILGTVIDVTDAKTREEVTQQLFQLTRALNKAKNATEILKLLAQPALDAGANATRFTYIEAVDGQPKWLEHVANWPQTEADTESPGAKFDLTGFPLTKLWFSDGQKPLICSNINTDERFDAVRPMMLQTGILAMVTIPLMSAGHWRGILVFKWPEPHQFSEQEIAFYNALPGLVAPVIESHRLLDSLETLAQKRMEKIKQTKRALESSENRFRLFFERSTDAILLLDGEKFIDCNQSTVEMMRCNNKDEFLMLHPSKLSPERQPDGRLSSEKADDMIRTAFEQGTHRFEWMHLRSTGEEFPVEVTLITFMWNHEPQLFTVWRDLSVAKEVEAEQKRFQEEIIQVQQRAIQELSVPIIPIMDGIIVMPLIGSIDSMRARGLMRTMLEGISQHRAKIVILDITGVSLLDTGIAGHLDKTIQAARLKGARTIITGISDAVAETVVDLGIDWSELETLGDLQTGLMVALQRLGMTIHHQ